MATKRKGLGRGLDALLGSSASATATKSQPASSTTTTEPKGGVDVSQPRDGDRLVNLPVDLIQRGKYQPRRDMNQEALQELADSIRAQGVMQPIVVRPISAEKYEIIAGERRWRATQLAGLQDIPCVVRDVTDDAAIAMALIENIQREDLNPMEEAFALKRLQDEFELTHQEVAAAVGKSRTTITNLLRLMSLTDEVKTMLEHGDLEMGHARALLALEGREQREAASVVVGKGLSVRQTEALVRKIQQAQPEAETQPEIGGDVLKLQERLSEKIGVPVAISYNAKGKGKMVLNYNSLDELDGILAHMGYDPMRD